MRGSAVMARKPVARTLPSTEFAASLLTTSAAGRPVRVTEITSSSNLGGATRDARKLLNRSMITAKATMEHKINGQIGQPAACMIDNNASPFSHGAASCL